uniref:NADH-ubiquinone oxidoreductase chain 3 n=1 Tax=Camponotus vafer TaxID=251259 RepID=G9J3F8_9HYME|nr:NADH dehydrogenase subunit 3 [Camponotus vafer]
MFFMMLMLTLFLLIALFILMLNIFISIKLLKNREKMSPFECGFDPVSKSRMPFSIQFFLISLIFLIFDIEITLLMPLVFLIQVFNKMYIFISFMFLLILIFGLLIEYLEKSIDWKT